MTRLVSIVAHGQSNAVCTYAGSSRGGHANWSGLEVWSGHMASHPDDPPRAARERIPIIANAWWSLQPPRAPEVPEVPEGGGSRNPVDRFLLTALHRARPAP